MAEQKSLARILLISAGTLLVGLGFLGIFLPLLPTTPFLLLAAACYVRSSQRFYGWLINHRRLGRYIKYYREGSGIPLKGKVIALALIWSTILSSAFIFVSQWWLRILLFLIAGSVSIYILSFKTLRAKP